MDKNDLIEEIKFCLDLWHKQQHCAFGKKTNCHECGSPYLLYKMITQKHISKKLSLKEWQDIVDTL